MLFIHNCPKQTMILKSISKQRFIIWHLFLILFIILFSSKTAYSRIMVPTPDELVKESEVIAIGKVISITFSARADAANPDKAFVKRYVALFEVQKIIKGELATPQISIYWGTYYFSCDCSSFIKDQKYLVFLIHNDFGDYHTCYHHCGIWQIKDQSVENGYMQYERKWKNSMPKTLDEFLATIQTFMEMEKYADNKNIPELIKKSEDKKRDVRLTSLKHLSQISGNKEVVTAVLKRINDDDEKIQLRALDISIKLKDKSVIPDVKEKLNDSNSEIRNKVIWVLYYLDAKETIPDIVKKLYDENERVRSAAIYALSQDNWHYKEAIPQIIKMMDDPSDDVREATISALVRLDVKEVIPRIIKMISDKNRSVQLKAMKVLSDKNIRESIPEIMKNLNCNNDSYVREIAIDSLAKLEANEAIPELIRLLDDKDAGVRCAVADALGKLGVKESIPGLLKLTKDKYVIVRDSAIQSLGDLGAQEIVPQLTKLMKKKGVSNSGTRRAAAGAAGKLGAKETVDGLIELLDDDDLFVRGVAAISLVELGAYDRIHREIIREIRFVLRFGDRYYYGDYQSRAETALKQIGVSKEKIELWKEGKED